MTATHRWTRHLSAVIAVVGCLAAAWLPGQAHAGLAWHESYAAAKSASQASERPVLVVFTATWCEACQHLDSRLWANAEAAALVGACYEPVMIDVDAHPEIARQMGISRIPSACVTDAQGQVLTTFDLPSTASTFIAQAARALQSTATATVAPTTTIAAQPAAQPTAQVAVAVPPAFQPAGTAPATFGTDGASRYGEQPGSAFANQPPAPSAFAAQQAPPVITQPTPTSPVTPQEAPWLAAAAAPAQHAPPQAPGAYPLQPPTAATQAPPGYYPATPPGPTAAPQQAPAAAPGQAIAAGTSPAQTLTPYPTSPQTLDSAAMATDREAEEKEEKATLMGAIQKQLAFMLPKKETAESEPEPAGLATAPSPYPVGFDGFCPVTLAEQAKWAEGRAQWGVQHRGRTYLFVGQEEQQRFLANPDRYAPALSGDDVVLAFESGQQMPGQRRYGVTYQARIYLFSSLETRSRFAANPQAYASRVRLAESPVAAGGSLVR